MSKFDLLGKSIFAICDGENDVISKMATIACELYHADDRFDWVGFYRNIDGKTLKIGPYQGGHGCLEIPFGRGVCGAVARDKKTLVVPDVNAFSDHIACSSTTLSEIVLPVFDSSGKMIAVLDIDSNVPDAFSIEDQVFLEGLLAEVF
jgi:GAF domain-containing protein